MGLLLLFVRSCMWMIPLGPTPLWLFCHSFFRKEKFVRAPPPPPTPLCWAFLFSRPIRQCSISPPLTKHPGAAPASNVLYVYMFYVWQGFSLHYWVLVTSQYKILYNHRFLQGFSLCYRYSYLYLASGTWKDFQSDQYPFVSHISYVHMHCHS